MAQAQPPRVDSGADASCPRPARPRLAPPRIYASLFEKLEQQLQRCTLVVFMVDEAFWNLDVRFHDKEYEFVGFARTLAEATDAAELTLDVFRLLVARGCLSSALKRVLCVTSFRLAVDDDDAGGAVGARDAIGAVLRAPASEHSSAHAHGGARADVDEPVLCYADVSGCGVGETPSPLLRRRLQSFDAPRRLPDDPKARISQTYLLRHSDSDMWRIFSSRSTDPVHAATLHSISVRADAVDAYDHAKALQKRFFGRH